MNIAIVPSPVGPLTLRASATAVTGLSFPQAAPAEGTAAWTPILRLAASQLEEYWAGRRRRFELPLDPPGTPFQRAVWSELQRIPYGHTVSYGELARRVGQPSASRAVGAANGRNPIAVIIPCHRVIGSSGKLVGFGGGLERKRFLLDLEHRGPGLFPGAFTT